MTATEHSIEKIEASVKASLEELDVSLFTDHVKLDTFQYDEQQVVANFITAFMMQKKANSADFNDAGDVYQNRSGRKRLYYLAGDEMILFFRGGITLTTGGSNAANKCIVLGALNIADKSFQIQMTKPSVPASVASPWSTRPTDTEGEHTVAYDSKDLSEDLERYLKDVGVTNITEVKFQVPFLRAVADETAKKELVELTRPQLQFDERPQKRQKGRAPNDGSEVPDEPAQSGDGPNFSKT